LKHTCNFAAE